MRLLFLGDHFADFGLDPFQIGFPTTTLDHFVVLLTHDDSPDIFKFLAYNMNCNIAQFSIFASLPV